MANGLPPIPDPMSPVTKKELNLYKKLDKKKKGKVYIELQADAFQSVLNSFSEKSFDFANVRRPFRGIEIKEDTYCVIKVIRSNGKNIPLVDAGSKFDPIDPWDSSQQAQPSLGSTFNYSNFIAQAIVEARSEKTQVVETFGEPYIFFFGEKPRILNVQGLLMNTLDFNWKNEFWWNYEHYLRGTRLVEMDARIYLYYDDQIVEGYILDASAQHDSNLPYHVPFNFTLFVTAHTFLGAVENSGFYPTPIGADIKMDELIAFQSLERTIKRLRDRKDKLRPDTLVSTIDAVTRASVQAAGGVIGVAAIKAAIIRGLSDYEAKTNAFFSNIKTYFYGRRTVVPRGIAGAEVYSGTAQHANLLTSAGTPPKRKLPLRSRISDNVDEYIGGGGDGATVAANLMSEALRSQQNIDYLTYEKQLLVELARMGVDVTQPSFAQTLRSKATHAIVETAGKVDFAYGIAVHGTGSLAHKGKQLAATMPNPLGK